MDRSICSDAWRQCADASGPAQDCTEIAARHGGQRRREISCWWRIMRWAWSKLDLAAAAFDAAENSRPASTIKGIDGLALPARWQFPGQPEWHKGTAYPEAYTFAGLVAVAFSWMWLRKMMQPSPILRWSPRMPAAPMSSGVSQWGSFGKDQQEPTKPLQPWRIVKLELNSPRQACRSARPWWRRRRLPAVHPASRPAARPAPGP